MVGACRRDTHNSCCFFFIHIDGDTAEGIDRIAEVLEVKDQVLLDIEIKVMVDDIDDLSGLAVLVSSVELVVLILTREVGLDVAHNGTELDGIVLRVDREDNHAVGSVSDTDAFITAVNAHQ